MTPEDRQRLRMLCQDAVSGYHCPPAIPKLALEALDALDAAEAHIRGQVEHIRTACHSAYNSKEQLKHVKQKLFTAEAIVEKLPKLVQGLYERREFAECWFPGSDDSGDCGNWPSCITECPLKSLGLLIGLVPQDDGGTDKQAAEATKGESHE